MAIIPPPPRWDDDHTVAVPLRWVHYLGTSTICVYSEPAPSIRVCRDCRCSRELCSCAWRRP